MPRTARVAVAFLVVTLMTLLPFVASGCGSGGGGGGFVAVIAAKATAGITEAIATFADGSFVVVGGFAGTETFGPGDPNETPLTSAGSRDIFVARFNADLTLAWARRAGGMTVLDNARAVTTVSDGTCLVTGRFGDGAVFGAGEAGETTLIPASAGVPGMFVACFGPNGDLCWAKGASGTHDTSSAAISSFADGSAVVVGNMTGITTFGAGEPGATVINAGTASQDVFVARYNATGTLAWVSAAGDAAADFTRADGVATLPTGQCVACGTFGGTAIFGPGAGGTVVAGALQNVFVARYEPDGTLGWVKRAGDAGYTSATAIAAYADGTSAVTGFFLATATFGPGEAGQEILTSLGGSDAFVARYSAGGALLWAKQAGGARDDEGLSIASFPDGACVAGGFLGDPSATFGPGEPGQTILSSFGMEDIFFARYQPDGTLAWAHKAGSTLNDETCAIASWATGRSVATGDILDPMTFGPGEPNETVLSGTSFLVRLGPGGLIE